MESPSSVKNANKKDLCGVSSKWKGKNHQKALVDITNDSPIVGVARAKLLDSPLAKPQRLTNATPGSGEALLRGQVKTLLQRVEDEAEVAKLTLPPFQRMHQRAPFPHSPMGLLAPTPANTPQLFEQPDVDEQHVVFLMVFLGRSAMRMVMEVACLQVEDDHLPLNRALFLEDVDALCQGMSKMEVKDGARFAGRHTRFVYDSEEEEIVDVVEVEVDGERRREDDGVLRLKGIPTPLGKHVRFAEDDGDDGGDASNELV